jgi:uncharacterized membrane protein
MARFVLEAAEGPPIHVRKVLPDAHWTWLSQGWSDFRRAWMVTLPAGVAVSIASMIIVFAMWRMGLVAFIPAACGGFAILGPLLAIGIYEVSRRLDAGEDVEASGLLLVHSEAPGQVAMIGFALMFLLLVWARLATLIYALAAGLGRAMPGEDFIRFALQTPAGLAMLTVGTLVGAGIAFAAFAIAAVSIPLCHRRKVDAMTAMVISCVAVSRNPGAMLAWAFNIALLVALSLVTGFLALAIVFPWLGHATWRAYRALIDDGLA